MIGVCPRPVNNQTDYYAVDLQIAKNAREEKLSARKQAQMTPEEIRQHSTEERPGRAIHAAVRGGACSATSDRREAVEVAVAAGGDQVGLRARGRIR